MDTNRTRLIGLSALAVLLALVVSACGAATTPAPTTVNVELKEWAVIPSQTSVPDGQVTFVVTNSGPADTHEFVVIKTDLDAFALRTDATGKVDENVAGIAVIGEIEDVAVGSTQTVTFDLAPGKYALICNIYDEVELEAHYKQGMLVSFTVQ